MRKTSLILPLLLSLTAASSHAVDVAPGAITYSHAGQGAVAPAGKPARVATVAGNYNPDPLQLYDAAQGWIVASRTSPFHSDLAIAVPFTPATDVKLKTLSVAISAIAGNNSVVLSLVADGGGVPGELIQSFPLTQLPQVGNCCVTDDVSIKGVKLVAGRTYWLQAVADTSTFAGWSLNNVGDTGPMAYNLGDGWVPISDTRPAFQVTGK